MRRSSPAPVAAAAAAGDGCGGHGGWLGCDDYVCCCPGGGGDGELGQRVSEGVGGCFPQEWLSWQGEWWSAEGVWAWGRCEKKHWRWLPLLLQLRDDCEWKALEMSLPLLWGWLGGQGCRRPRRHASPAGVAAAAAAVAPPLPLSAAKRGGEAAVPGKGGDGAVLEEGLRAGAAAAAEAAAAAPPAPGAPGAADGPPGVLC
mmetsp:Transcript_18243/g.51141  ORF Transcript_18243/g.51141 Transcript_18243/m.51141 type:complete len:201 (-) Transcript_18243:2748-3350(-)